VGINAHRALYSASTDENYLGSLTVDEPEREELREVRDEIRAALKEGFAKWPTFIRKQQLFEAAALTFADGYEPTLSPKFRMQGSWSYDTLNQITYDPPQEIDLDDGMFLPISFLTQNGETHPAIVSGAYFDAVEAILGPLCEERGWKLNRDKSSCVRVEIRQGAHVDLALYAIPDEDFRRLVEKAAARSGGGLARVVFDEAMAFDDVYPTLPADHIMLAHRKEGWKPSDPRKLETWFREAIERHGYQLRRVCRYLKGWRDYTWKGCRLSSIALMATVVTAFDDALKAPPENRDDLALQMVASGLGNVLSTTIRNPVVDGQILDEGWDDDGCRVDFVSKARELAQALKIAISADTKASGLSVLRRTLGDYIPNNFELLEIVIAATPTILDKGLIDQAAAQQERRDPVKIGGEPRYG
jgi:hypothetical protein